MQITKKRKKWLRKEISYKPLKIRKIKKGILTSSMRHPVSQPSQSGQVEQWFDGVLLF